MRSISGKIRILQPWHVTADIAQMAKGFIVIIMFFQPQNLPITRARTSRVNPLIWWARAVQIALKTFHVNVWFSGPSDREGPETKTTTSLLSVR